MQEKNAQDTIDLVELLGVIKKNIIFILIAGILGSVVGFAYTRYTYVPYYSSSGTMLVNAKTDETGSSSTGAITSQDKLIATYAIIIKSDRVLVEVIENLDLNMDYKELVPKISVTSVDETQIMRITVTDIDPIFAQTVIKEIMNVCPAVIIDVFGGGSVKTISEPEIPTSPVTKNSLTEALMLGVLLSLIVAVVFVLKSIFDTRIKSETDIEEVIDAPIIGVIPTIESCDKNKKGGHYARKK